VRCEVLGGIRLAHEEHPVEVGSPSQRLVLAVLASRAGSVVASDTLVDALWGDHPPTTARQTLRAYVSRLRRLLGDDLAVRPDGYELALGADSLDSRCFEELLEAARTRPPVVAVAGLDTALGLWHGRPFAELADHRAVRDETARLELCHLEARELRAALLLELGEHAAAAAAARAVVEADPVRESAWAVLVDAQAMTSPATALETFREAATVLAEVGLDPSPPLRQAQRRALTGNRAPTGERARRPVDPPSYRTRLVGRDDDVRDLTRLLGEARLVTLVGPGGVGKTRLAAAVAAQAGVRHHLGSRFVAFGELVEPAAVAPAITDALGWSGVQLVPTTALRGAGHLDLLLVLDSCEHLADAVAAAVDELLADGDSVRVLATSRRRLGVEGERVRTVAPLPATDDGSPAPTLFRERAESGGAPADDLDPAAVRRIVRRLDGLPLAIEMAASLVPVLGTAELERVLAEDPSVLQAPTRGVPPRHRSLAALIDWSLDDLPADGSAMLRALAEFEGGFGRADVATMTRSGVAALPLLRELVERSLLTGDPAGGGRLRMLRTVRHHVQGRTPPPERKRLRDRHLEHLAVVAREADARLRTALEAEADSDLRAAHPDLGAAHLWACEHRPTLAADLTRDLHVWALSRQVADPFRWAERAVLDTSAAAAAARSQALFNRGRAVEALRTAEAALERATGRDVLLLEEARGDILLALGDLDAARGACRRLGEQGVETADPHYAVVGRCGEALAMVYGGDRVGAAELMSDLLVATERGAGSGTEGAVAPTDRGWCAYVEAEVRSVDEPDVAAARFGQAIVCADQAGNRLLGGVARVSLAALRAERGDPAASLADLLSVVEHWQESGVHSYLVTSLRNLAVLLLRLDEPEQAARVLGVVEEAARVPTYGEEAARLAATATELDRLLGTAAYRLAHAQGRATSITELLSSFGSRA
jgi:predicted ATPase/DNA-binding SARP family transcriptional activator